MFLVLEWIEYKFFIYTNHYFGYCPELRFTDVRKCFVFSKDYNNIREYGDDPVTSYHQSGLIGKLC